jgi:hypothetical protein
VRPHEFINVGTQVRFSKAVWPQTTPEGGLFYVTEGEVTGGPISHQTADGRTEVFIPVRCTGGPGREHETIWVKERHIWEVRP